MIGYLKGVLKYSDKSKIIIDVNGVGYEIQVLEINRKVGERIELFVHTYVREDQISLYGFETINVLNIFKLMINIKGIGPKVAQRILSNLKVDEIYSAISNEDIELLCTVPGIGKKGAQRLILEMHTKIKRSLLTFKDNSSNNDRYKKNQEAVQALKSLGFESRQAKNMISSIELAGSDSVEDIIKKALSQK